MGWALNEGKMHDHVSFKQRECFTYSQVHIKEALPRKHGALQGLKPDCSSGKHFQSQPTIVALAAHVHLTLHVLTYADTGPFPVLGISVFCWSNSDSNFKMLSAA